jgi:beta-glucosidase-like glycosyl hydrolase
VKSKAIPVALIDKAVGRVLKAKFELGLFEQPYVDVEQADKIAGSAEHAALARKAAERSIVLLKNAGGLLPLDRAKVKTIAVVGPTASRAASAAIAASRSAASASCAASRKPSARREGDLGARLRDHARQ